MRNLRPHLVSPVETPFGGAASLPTPDSYIDPINTKGYIADGFPTHLFEKDELIKGLDIGKKLQL